MVDEEIHELRSEFEGDAGAAGAAGDRGAIEISLVIADEVGAGPCTVRSNEGVEKLVGPLAVGGGAKFVDHAAATVRIAAASGCAVQIACRVEDHSRSHIASVRIVGEAMQDGLLPASIRRAGQLENCTVACRTANLCGAIDVASTVENESSDSGECSVARTAKAVQDVLLPLAARGGRQFEHRAAPAITVLAAATVLSGSVQVAGRVQDWPLQYPVSVAIECGEAVQDLLLPFAANLWRQLKCTASNPYRLPDPSMTTPPNGPLALSLRPKR